MLPYNIMPANLHHHHYNDTHTECVGYPHLPHRLAHHLGNLVFYDIHDGDHKLVQIVKNKMTILPYKSNQHWIIESDLNRNLTSRVNFSVPGKPKPPPVPLTLKFSEIQSFQNGGKTFVALFFDETGTISSPSVPVNIWYNV